MTIRARRGSLRKWVPGLSPMTQPHTGSKCGRRRHEGPALIREEFSTYPDPIFLARVNGGAKASRLERALSVLTSISRSAPPPLWMWCQLSPIDTVIFKPLLACAIQSTDQSVARARKNGCESRRVGLVGRRHLQSLIFYCVFSVGWRSTCRNSA